jgi:hypothetical protein
VDQASAITELARRGDEIVTVECADRIAKALGHTATGLDVVYEADGGTN